MPSHRPQVAQSSQNWWLSLRLLDTLLRKEQQREIRQPVTPTLKLTLKQAAGFRHYLKSELGL
jgi:hypothetical protein